MKQYILAIDLGTGGPKVSLFDSEARFIAYETVPNQVNLLPHGGAEQHPADWWLTIDEAFRTLIAKTKIDSLQISHIGCTGQWSGTVPVNDSGEVVHPALIWMDSRGEKQIHKLFDGLLKIQGYDVLKVLKWLRLCNGVAGMSGKDSLAHILFLKNEKPEVYAQTHKFLEPMDYINFLLTGKMVASYHSITLHWLTDNRNVNEVKYSRALLKATGIHREKLPDLIPCNTIVGKVTPAIAHTWNLSPDCQVIAATGDVMSAAVGSGAVEDNQPHLYVGTSSWLVCHMANKKLDMDHNMATLPSAMPGLWLLANEQETAGNCINFLRHQLLYPKDAFESGTVPADFYKRLNEVAASVNAGSDGLLFLPWLYGERSPVEDHSVRGGFFNLSLQHSRSHLVRAIMEGVAFNSRWLFQFVQKNTGRKAERIHFIGGGAQSELWCQIVSDVLNCKVVQMENPVMANAKGVALLALMAQGKLNRAQIPALVKPRREFAPDPSTTETYNQLFEVFTAYYRANRKLHRKLNG